MTLLRAVATAAVACLLAAGCGSGDHSVGTGAGTAPSPSQGRPTSPTTSLPPGTSGSPIVSSPPLGPATTVKRAPISRPSTHGVIQLTSADADATFLVAIGQTVQLTLSDPGTQWGQVNVTPAGLLAAAPSPASPPQGRLVVWVAAKPGTAKVTSVATAYCPTGAACPMWARLFAVTLIIVK